MGGGDCGGREMVEINVISRSSGSGVDDSWGGDSWSGDIFFGGQWGC